MPLIRLIRSFMVQIFHNRIARDVADELKKKGSEISLRTVWKCFHGWFRSCFQICRLNFEILFHYKNLIFTYESNKPIFAFWNHFDDLIRIHFRSDRFKNFQGHSKYYTKMNKIRTGIALGRRSSPFEVLAVVTYIAENTWKSLKV